MSRCLGVAAFAALLALAAGCTSSRTPIRRVDLRAATGQADPSPAGIAVDPTGARFVLDDGAGLYRFGAGGGLDLVLPLADLPDPGVVVRPPFTDLVAVAPGRFAITAIGDGYLLDVARRTMTRYFCYVPDGLPQEYDQRTDAVTYDPDADLVYAQPRTFDANGGLISSQVASYASATGADLEWRGVPLAVAAGGMAKLPGVAGLVLGNGSQLLRLDDTGVTSQLDDLARFGIAGIAGLAVDPSAGTLLVLDGPGDALVELDLADVGP